jgi:hypothetical protein
MRRHAGAAVLGGLHGAYEQAAEEGLRMVCEDTR